MEAGAFCAHSCNYLVLSSSQYPVEFVLAALNSRVVNWAFKALSTNSNVNSYEIEALALPLADQATVLRVARLARMVLHTRSQDASADTSIVEGQIDEIMFEMYGLNEDEIAIVEGQSG